MMEFADDHFLQLGRQGVGLRVNTCLGKQFFQAVGFVFDRSRCWYIHQKSRCGTSKCAPIGLNW